MNREKDRKLGLARISAGLVIGLMMGILMCTAPAFADEDGEAMLGMELSSGDKTVEIHTTAVDGTRYFFLPSGVKDENITKEFDEAQVKEDVDYRVMQSGNITSVHFVSANPETEGMSWVHSNKNNKASGKVFVFDKDFNCVYDGNVDALKGRGNTSWAFTQKKSYQMKLKKKADILNPAEGNQKAKKWVLLANSFDPTMIRNEIIFDISRQIGLDSTPDGEPVDLYYDGEYRGTYYLCEKIEVGDGRVEIDDLEDATEEKNPELDFDAQETVTEENSLGLKTKYVTGITNPEDFSGGYLLELDNAFYSKEKSWFTLRWGDHIVCRSPEYISKEMAEYISVMVQNAFDYAQKEKAQFNEGAELSKYFDLESLAEFYLINEWFDVQDCWVSSTFMYKKKGEDVLYAGPVWDCDASMQNRWMPRRTDAWFSKGLSPNFLALPQFRQAMQDVYKNKLKPAIYGTLLTEDGQSALLPQELKERLPV